MTESSINNLKYNVVEIVKGTIVDGPGFRTSIYLAGCNHQCPGCHNPQTWHYEAGTSMTLEEILEIVKEEDFDVTLSGGDPFFDTEKLYPLVKEIKSLGYNIWVYTGYRIEEIEAKDAMKRCLQFIDVVVDGKFIKALHNPDLRFRGSTNQKIIDIKTRKELDY